MNAHDRKSFCKVDFERAVNHLKRQKFMAPSDLSSEISSITIDFFNQVRIFSRQETSIPRNDCDIMTKSIFSSSELLSFIAHGPHQRNLRVAADRRFLTRSDSLPGLERPGVLR